MHQAKTFEVVAEETGLRLDRWFKRRFPELVHGRLEKLLRTGQVRVDGGRVKAGFRLDAGQQVRVPPLLKDLREGAQQRPLLAPRITEADKNMLRSAVLHMDDALIVINKPPGLAVQGGSRTSRHVDGMLDALRFDCPERPRLVHRLDRDTSGVLLLARNATAANKLGQAFRGHTARKTYWALTAGVPRPHIGRIQAPLAKLGGDAGTEWEARERVSAVAPDDPRGRSADTLYKVIEAAGQSVAWVAFMPLTGRTHQIRAHAALIGTPIAGDRKYGGEAATVHGVSSKLHLHARSISIPHPNGGILSVSAPLPAHMLETWKFFEFNPELSGDPFAEWES